MLSEVMNTSEFPTLLSFHLPLRSTTSFAVLLFFAGLSVHLFLGSWGHNS